MKLVTADAVARVALVVVCAWAAHVARDRHAAQLITCGAALHTSAVLTLVTAPHAGVGFPGLVLLAGSLGLRLCSTCFYQGYLPVDASGDGPYQAIEVLGLLLTLKVCAGFRHCEYRPALSAAALAAVWASVCYGSLDKHPTFDTIYAMSVWVEVAACAFQTLHVLAQGPDLTPVGFLAPQALGMVCRLRFWLAASSEITPKSPVRLQHLFPQCLTLSHVCVAIAYGLLCCRGVLRVRDSKVLPDVPVPVPKDTSSLTPICAVYTDEGTLRVTYKPEVKAS